MNREELKTLGLTDEQIESVMASHGKVFNPLKESLETVTTDRDALKGQIADRDTQLEKLGEIDADGLNAEIERLKIENASKATEYQGRLDKQSFDFGLERALTGAKARNPKAVRALLDSEIIKLGEDGNLIGLSEQITTLKETDGYLFESEEGNAPPPAPGYKPGSQQRTNTPGTIEPKEAGRLKALERHKKEE